MDLTEKTILVTGASSGVGRQVALTAAEQGASIVNADLTRGTRGDGQPTDALIEERGGTAEYIETDVADLDSVRRAADVADTYNRLDIVVNNAGVAESYALSETSTENWQQSIAVNLTGVYHGCRAAIEMMTASRNGDMDESGETGGAIVNIASVFGVIGGPNSFAYSAAKGGVISLTRQLARDYAGDGIRANAVSPGFVETPMLENDTHEGTRTFAKQTTPMRRVGTPSEVADAIVYLASDAASFVTGQNLVVDGGFSVA